MATVALQRAPPYRPSMEPPPATFHLLRRWQEYLEVSSRCNERTRRQYRRCVVGFLADTLLEASEVTEDDVIAYIAAMDPRGGMRAQVLKALHSLYGWAARREVLASNPVRAIPIPRSKYGRAPTLGAEARAALFAAGEQVDPRARPAMELMYATGGRLGSICGVHPSDVFVAASGRRWVHFATAKDGRAYDVPLSRLGTRAVDRLLGLHGYQPPRARTRLPTLVGVRPGTLWAWVHRASVIAGVQAHPHLLRHDYATDLEDVDDRTWAALMNHRDASLRTRYAAPKDERMEAAVEMLG